MNLDDDRIREALRASVQPSSASAALHELRPSMRRARWQRKLASSAAGVTVLVGVGAGVAALANGPQQPTNPTVSVDATLSPANTTSAPLSAAPAATTDVTAPLVVEATGPVASTTAKIPEPGADGPATTVVVVTPTSVPPPVPTTRPGPAPTTPAPATPGVPTTPASTVTSQTITSACGDVVVSINGATLQILSIAPAAGFVVRVGDDGPTSIEVRFTGNGDTTCEVHAEMKSDGLDVEVQNPG